MKELFSERNVIRAIVFLILCVLSYFNWEWVVESNTNIFISLILFFAFEFGIGFIWDTLKYPKKVKADDKGK
ncbi:hypothetical protein ACLWBD_12810 [Bdellovibrio sp. HCB117]|uniref:hypothetical protein n=1 Tax=Bdellovibrio sp. HCB117 TaxID=3394359 RepID=UPI0039B66B99